MRRIAVKSIVAIVVVVISGLAVMWLLRAV